MPKNLKQKNRPCAKNTIAKKIKRKVQIMKYFESIKFLLEGINKMVSFRILTYTTITFIQFNSIIQFKKHTSHYFLLFSSWTSSRSWCSFSLWRSSSQIRASLESAWLTLKRKFKNQKFTKISADASAGNVRHPPPPASECILVGLRLATYQRTCQGPCKGKFFALIESRCCCLVALVESRCCCLVALKKLRCCR